MCTSREPDTICLNVAIDHRIRALFQPVRRVAEGGIGAYVSTITALGRKVTDDAETLVIGQLAKPETTGGLAVILQKPQDDHFFDEGLEAVIEDCPTFWAPYELLYTVSCVSEACGAYVGNWTESSWMDDLREACAKQSEELRANCKEFSSDGNGFESDFEDDSDSESTDSLRDEGERVVSHYCSSLDEVVKAIRAIAMSHGNLYELLLDSLLTTRLNDASLALRYMHHLENDYDWSIPELLVSVTCNLIEQDFAAYEWSGSEAIKQEILDGVRELASCVSCSEYVDVENAVEVFLHTAEALERILGDTMERCRWRLLHEELAGIELEFEC